MKKFLTSSIIFLALTFLFLGCKKDLVQNEKSKEIYLNKIILKTLESYERDGRYPYSWVGGYEGVTKDLYYQDQKIAKANSDSSHSTFCCGVTFEAYFESIMSQLKKDEDLNGMQAEDFKDFIARWFVLEMNGDGPGLALNAYGVGKSIEKMKDVLPGDFVQIWRTSGSGHSVIFIEWLIDENNDTTGMKYWSTQTSTNGVNYNNEYFDGFGGKVDKSITHYSRAYMPGAFK